MVSGSKEVSLSFLIHPLQDRNLGSYDLETLLFFKEKKSKSNLLDVPTRKHFGLPITLGRRNKLYIRREFIEYPSLFHWGRD